MVVSDVSSGGGANSQAIMADRRLPMMVGQPTTSGGGAGVVVAMATGMAATRGFGFRNFEKQKTF